MSELEVEASDVIKIVLQFLKENSLHSALHALQEESQVALNTVDNLDKFVSDIQHGHWDSVLGVVATLKLPQRLLVDLYEQIIFELLELRELDTARQVLRSTAAMSELKERSPARHAKLETLASRPYFDVRDAYGATSKEQRRNYLAEQLKAEVSVVPPSRLLALLGHSLKWQQSQGQLPLGSKFDLFAGSAAQQRLEPETYVSAPGPVIKFGKKCHAESAAFSPDGQYLISGSIDGFLEVWDFERGKIRKDLLYQEQDEFMMHEHPVLSLCFSRDSELVASGDQEGCVKVWRLRNGQCVRRFAKAHGQGVTCLSFNRDGTQLATGSFDSLGRVHGLKSGKALKELRGHTSYVNEITYSPDGLLLVTGSSDGSVKVWEAKTGDCTATFRPPQAAASDLSVNNVLFLPGNPEQLVVCNRSPNIYIMTLKGTVVQTLASGKREGGEFVRCCVTAAGGWVHAIAEDSHLYSFDVKEGKLQHLLKVHDKEAIGLAVHPHRNVVSTWGDDSTMKLWRAGNRD